MPGTTDCSQRIVKTFGGFVLNEDAKGAEQRGGKSKLSESGVRDGVLTLAEV